MMTVSPTCSEDGFFINSDFVIEYYLCVKHIKTTMMPNNICFLNRSFKRSYRWKGRYQVTLKPGMNEPGNECLFCMRYAGYPDDLL
jgi:hypothetical protein